MMGQKTLEWKYLWCLWMICVVSVKGRVVNHNPDSPSEDKSSSDLLLETSPINVFSIHESVQGDKDVLKIKGSGFHTTFQVGITKFSQGKGTECPAAEVVDLGSPFQRTLQSDSPDEALLASPPDYILPNHNYFFCTKSPDSSAWIHQGVSLVHGSQIGAEKTNGRNADHHHHRESRHRSASNFDYSGELRNREGIPRASFYRSSEVEVYGMSFEYESDKKRVTYDSQGSPRVLEGMPLTIRLYGIFDNSTFFKLTKFQKCDDPHNREKEYKVKVTDPSSTVGEVSFTMPHMGELNEVYLCLRTENKTFVRQGEDGAGVVKPWLVMRLSKAMLPLWLHITLLTILLTLSGLFSGLNLGLMSLNKTDLKIIINTGTAEERDFASRIAPVRNHGNFLLCCLLFSNVLVNASLTILVDDLTSGIIAVIMSTLAIVIFGEIIPQAICSRHGLAVGAKTIYVTKFFMCITLPLAYPLSKLLDKLLGEEIGSVYTRERLKELLRVTKDHHGLETEEVGIISGALEMKTKTVKDIMVRLDNSFMLPIDAVLDFDTMAEVEYHGYSRIPIYERERTNIVALLNVKQLTLLDANDNIPLKTVIEYYQNSLFFVFENTRLDFMFRTFREGSKGHMAFVQRINNEGPGDPFYETIGLVTMEDVLEELLQAEIMDESDIGKYEARLANSTNSRPKNNVPFLLSKRKTKPPVEIPAPLALAACQFLSSSVEPFKKQIMSVGILQRLIASSAEFIKLPKNRGNAEQPPDLFLYESGKPAEYFILILEGRVEVTVGQEKLSYESGAFTTFGKDFLMLEAEKSKAVSPVSVEKPELKPKRRTFVPDYTVRVISDILYLMLKFSAYNAAILATEIERANADPGKRNNKDWQDEIEKVLEDGDDDTVSECGRKPKISRDEDGLRKISVVTTTAGYPLGENEMNIAEHPDEQTKLL